MSSLQSPGHIACIAFLALLFFPPHRLVRQNPPSSAYPDNSDWWSGLNSSGSDEVVNVQERELPPTTFRVLGIALSEEMFRRAAAKLGKAQILERGDASTGRSQACYVSSKGSPKTFLIFEQGEVDFGFYLFSDSRPWNGMDRCTPSALVSDEISIALGLHLGQLPAEVIAILGKPSRRSKDELLYSLHAKKKNSPEDLRRARQANPNMSDTEFHENYDFYDLGVGILARFTNSRLTYLSVSKSETT
jgi:hypothetical protein